MKQIILLFLILNVEQILGQNMLPLPENPQLGREYAKCIEYDTAYSKNRHGALVLPFAWEEFLLEKSPKTLRFIIELPVFDTIILKIPVDKTTRMANLPDEYGLTKDKVQVSESSFKWVTKKRIKECLSTEPANCLTMAMIEMPAEYKTIQKLVIKSTAHQEYFEDKDTFFFKQIVETKPLKRISVEVPPQYKRIFMKTNPNASYTKWQQIVCTSHGDLTIKSIQKALVKRGYDVGTVDDILGTKTKAALMRFQKVNNLPMGNLNIETLKALRIEGYEDYDD
jgi:hypothetical protein